MKLKTALLRATLSLGATLGLSAQAEEIICETKEICQKLSQSIQAQINELEAKGLSNFSRQERIQYSQLTDDLIALENQKQAQQQEVIANENQKQANIREERKENKKTIDEKKQEQNQKLDEQNAELKALRGILLSK